LGGGECAPRATFSRDQDAQEASILLQAISSADRDASGSIVLAQDDLPMDLNLFTRNTMRTALEASRSMSSLTITDVNPTGTRRLLELLQGCTHIKEVKFMAAHADDALAKLLGVLLRPVWTSGPSLQSIIIANKRKNLLTDSGAIAIAQALNESASLRTLVLFGTRMGDDGAFALISALKRNTTLQTLVYNGKALSGRGVRAFAKWVKAGNIFLKELIIGGSEFCDEDAECLAKAVVSRRHFDIGVRLCNFGLLNFYLGDSCADAISELLSCGLLEFSLFAGNLSDEGVAQIARPLSTGSSIVKVRLNALRIASSRAGDLGLQALEKEFALENPSDVLELAFGEASKDACSKFAAKLRSLSRPASSERNASASSDSNCHSFHNNIFVTSALPEYLEDVLFTQLMQRAPATRPVELD